MNISAPLRILIVEDEALLAIELQALLAEAGHEVVGWATSAAEALRLTTAKRPDLAFLDLRLSDGNAGIDLVARLKDVANCVAVIMTANTAILPLDYGGAIGVIAKPYSASGLLSVLRYLHEGLRKPPPLSARPSSLRLSPRYLECWNLET